MGILTNAPFVFNDFYLLGLITWFGLDPFVVLTHYMLGCVLVVRFEIHVCNCWMDGNYDGERLTDHKR